MEIRQLNVSVSVSNNSNKTWICNNNQQNILLLDKDNKEVSYSVPKPEICSHGESKLIGIEFAIDKKFVPSRLKFITPKEIMYVELEPRRDSSS